MNRKRARRRRQRRGMTFNLSGLVFWTIPALYVLGRMV